jgi:hypothetical protein
LFEMLALKSGFGQVFSHHIEYGYTDVRLVRICPFFAVCISVCGSGLYECYWLHLIMTASKGGTSRTRIGIICFSVGIGGGGGGFA